MALDLVRRRMSDSERTDLERRIRLLQRFWFREVDWGLSIGLLVAAGIAALFGQSAWPILLLGAGAAALLAVVAVGAIRSATAHNRKLMAQWRPILDRGEVDDTRADVVQARRLDDGSDTAWFLDVGEGRILVVWDWCEEARREVRIVVAAENEQAVAVMWGGEPMAAVVPKRLFSRSERQPRQGEVLNGELANLDALLRKQRARRAKKRSPASGLEALGLFRFVAPEDLDEVKENLDGGPEDWLRSVGRAFDADAERLAEGGVADLLDYLRPLLEQERVRLGTIEQTYDVERGYCLRLDGRDITLWSKTEAKRSWELTTERLLALLNQRLTESGSAERAHVLHGGEDGVLVLAPPALWERIARG